MTLRETLLKLEAVQELDLQIGVLQKKKNEMPARLASYDSQISLLTTQLEQKKKISEEIEKNLRQNQGALELNEERMKRSQTKAEAIKTNQEFQAVQKEIEALKKNTGVLQENVTKLKSELEVAQKSVEDIQTQISAIEATRASESEKIGGESKEFDTELGRLSGLRAQAVVGIDVRHLSQYDRVRSGRVGGVGIVPAVSGNCKGCNMRIPPQIYNELKRGNELHFCPSCRRILLYKEAADTQKSSGSSAGSH